MLKIYLRKDMFELRNNNKTINLNSYTTTIIKNESEAISKIAEFGAYTDDAAKAYVDCVFKQKHKGIQATYCYYDGWISLNQWLAPDAKLIRYRTYEEYSCSMKNLMTLPAPDVIAYLKQEGASLMLSS